MNNYLKKLLVIFGFVAFAGGLAAMDDDDLGLGDMFSNEWQGAASSQLPEDSKVEASTGEAAKSEVDTKPVVILDEGPLALPQVKRKTFPIAPQSPDIEPGRDSVFSDEIDSSFEPAKGYVGTPSPLSMRRSIASRNSVTPTRNSITPIVKVRPIPDESILLAKVAASVELPSSGIEQSNTQEHSQQRSVTPTNKGPTVQMLKAVQGTPEKIKDVSVLVGTAEGNGPVSPSFKSRAGSAFTHVEKSPLSSAAAVMPTEAIIKAILLFAPDTLTECKCIRRNFWVNRDADWVRADEKSFIRCKGNAKGIGGVEIKPFADFLEDGAALPACYKIFEKCSKCLSQLEPGSLDWSLLLNNEADLLSADFATKVQRITDEKKKIAKQKKEKQCTAMNRQKCEVAELELDLNREELDLDCLQKQGEKEDSRQECIQNNFTGNVKFADQCLAVVRSELTEMIDTAGWGRDENRLAVSGIVIQKILLHLQRTGHKGIREGLAIAVRKTFLECKQKTKKLGVEGREIMQSVRTELSKIILALISYEVFRLENKPGGPFILYDLVLIVRDFVVFCGDSEVYLLEDLDELNLLYSAMNELQGITRSAARTFYSKPLDRLLGLHLGHLAAPQCETDGVSGLHCLSKHCRIQTPDPTEEYKFTVVPQRQYLDCFTPQGRSDFEDVKQFLLDRDILTENETIGVSRELYVKKQNVFLRNRKTGIEYGSFSVMDGHRSGEKCSSFFSSDLNYKSICQNMRQMVDSSICVGDELATASGKATRPVVGEIVVANDTADGRKREVVPVFAWRLTMDGKNFLGTVYPILFFKNLDELAVGQTIIDCLNNELDSGLPDTPALEVLKTILVGTTIKPPYKTQDHSGKTLWVTVINDGTIILTSSSPENLERESLLLKTALKL